MRLNIRHLPTAALASLPLAAAHWGWSTPAAAAALASVALARQAAVLTDVATRARPSKRKMVLETISLSHYAEKVRWTMDALGSDYVEEQDAAIMGVFLTGRTIPGLRVPNRNFTIYNSADILRYLYAKNYNDPVSMLILYNCASGALTAGDTSAGPREVPPSDAGGHSLGEEAGLPWGRLEEIRILSGEEKLTILNEMNKIIIFRLFLRYCKILT